MEILSHNKTKPLYGNNKYVEKGKRPILEASGNR